MRVQRCKRLISQTTQGGLLNAFCRRIKRCQRVIERCTWLAVAQYSIFRMHHFKHTGTATRFTKALDPGATLKLGDLRFAEVEETQRNGASTIIYSHQ